MQKIIRINNKIIVILDSGITMEQENLTEEEIASLHNATTTEEVFYIMNKEAKEILQKKEKVDKLIYNINSSKLLSFEGNCIYWKEVSPLSMPRDLADEILKAEANNEEIKLETYKNFWTLLSLNPNEETRQNLWWFLNKWGLKISRCGFFVAYRNVDFTKEKDVYTDHHSHTFKIKIGEIVTMPRELCDCDSSNSCSRGLHAGGAGRLKKNYYGNLGLVVLINPYDVTAVPHIDNYGKLRCCAYLPICEAQFDDTKNIIPYKEETGFDCEYVPQVIYEGIMGTETDSAYKIDIPEIPGITKESMTDKLLDIAREAIINRVVNE